jgi:hypothetical protein
LTAAAAGKPAFEGYRGHGGFTWALIVVQGDTNGDGLIELSELATPVQNTVPKISAEMNGRGIAEASLSNSESTVRRRISAPRAVISRWLGGFNDVGSLPIKRTIPGWCEKD